MKIILLTKEQAEEIKNKYGLYSEIDPVKLIDGNYMLPESVFNDPDLKEFQNNFAYLKENIINIENIKDVDYCNFNKYYITDYGIAKCIETHNNIGIFEKDKFIADYESYETEI